MTNKSLYSTAFITLIFLWSAIAVTGCSESQSRSGTASEAEPAAADFAPRAEKVTPVLTGTRIPDAEIRNTDNVTVRLREVVSRKPTVLIFYRGGWCPYCNRHMAELQQAEERMIELGYQIVAISPDKPELLRQSIEKHDLTYSLYSDSPMTASKAFGLAFRLDDETFNRYKNNGLDLTRRSGYDHHLLPVPAVFLVDRQGLIHFQYVNPDYTTRIKSPVLLAAAEAYYPDKDESGEN